MKSKSTWYLFLTAACMLAFILLWESRHSPTDQTKRLEKRVFPGLMPHRISQIELVSKSNLVLRVERTNDLWALVQPVRFPAHAGRINRFLEHLSALIGVSVLNAQDLKGQDLTAFGFEPPQLAVVLHHGTDRLEFHLGNRTSVGDETYLRVIGTAGLEVVSSDLLSLLPAKTDDWRDNTLLGMKLPEFSRLEVRMPAPFGFALEQDPHRVWRLAKPLPLRADNAKINHLLQQLRQAVVTGFVDASDGTNLDAFGLQPPRAELALCSATNTNDVLIVRFGLSPTNHPQEVFGWQSQHGQVFRVDKALADSLSVPYTELRDRRLLSVPLEAANCIEMQTGETVILQRLPNDQWVVTSPVSMPADNEIVRAFFRRLNSLDVLEFTKDVVTDFSNFGLASPARRLILRQALPNPVTASTNYLVMQLDFSTNQTDRLLVRRHDENSVYALRLSDFEQLPQAAHQWRDRHVWHYAASNAMSFVVSAPGINHRLRRDTAGRWELAGLNRPLHDPIPMMIDELLHRLGSMQVDAWLARGQDKLESYGMNKDEHQTWEIQLTNRAAPLVLVLGNETHSSTSRYAAVVQEDQPFVFELPPIVYSLFLEVIRSLSSPAAAAASNPPP
jgi:hypothetical protein